MHRFGNETQYPKATLLEVGNDDLFFEKKYKNVRDLTKKMRPHLVFPPFLTNHKEA